jgi:hypothetical protein
MNQKRGRLPRPTTRIPFASHKYAPPTPDEVQLVSSQILGLSGSETAKLVGVADGRTVRKWIGGESQVPYSVWRLLLLEAGLALDMDEQAIELIGANRAG